jgi:lipoic acid synthetase
LGVAHWVKVIKAIKAMNPGVTIEVLIPDFQGKTELIDMIIEASPEVISHNLETVRRLSKQVRSRATYDGSLNVIRRVSASGAIAKSGIMLGLGETRDEILETMDDLLRARCRVMTIGQYLQPSRNNLPVTEYIRPEVFAEYRQIGKEKGFVHIESSPLVRSSYHAEKHIHPQIIENSSI